MLTIEGHYLRSHLNPRDNFTVIQPLGRKRRVVADLLLFFDNCNISLSFQVVDPG